MLCDFDLLLDAKISVESIEESENSSSRETLLQTQHGVHETTAGTRKVARNQKLTVIFDVLEFYTDILIFIENPTTELI